MHPLRKPNWAPTTLVELDSGLSRGTWEKRRLYKTSLAGETKTGLRGRRSGSNSDISFPQRA